MPTVDPMLMDEHTMVHMGMASLRGTDRVLRGVL
jgi:hypothetical protein